jgi:cation diffusion facilitator CzcD-associated flavoprotein CzcO
MDTPRQRPRAESESGDRGDFDVVVVGAGQAGLAIGYFLARRGQRFVILEAGDSIGQAWRTRWNSLVLFTSRRYSGLPGSPFPGDPEGYATRDEVLAYLEQYAATFKLPVRLGTPVRRLGHAAGRFGLELDGGRMEAGQVVVATGPFQVPRIPPIASQLAPEVFQVHSTGYMEPSDVPAGTVVVVGGGNTGFQIAKELSATRPAYLAVGSRMTPLPQMSGRRVSDLLDRRHKGTATTLFRAAKGAVMSPVVSLLYPDQSVPVLHGGRRATFLHMGPRGRIIRYWGDSHAASVPPEPLSHMSRTAKSRRPPAASDEPITRER